MYIPVRFKAYELVDKATYDVIGADAFNMIDPRLLEFIDALSFALERHHKRRIRLICNNWYWHKDPTATDYFQWRGLRTKMYHVYSRTSYHSKKPCQALDMHSPDISSTALIDFVLTNQDEDWCKSIGGVEMGVNWLHADLRPRLPNGRIFTFRV